MLTLNCMPYYFQNEEVMLINRFQTPDMRRIDMGNLLIKLKNFMKELEEINKEVATLPIGHLVRKGKFYYHRIGKKDTGITKKPEIIRLLCRKKYLIARKEQLANMMLDIKCFDIYTPRELITEFSSVYQELPISYFYHPLIETWLAEPYEKHPYPSEAGWGTKNGVSVRSKSEYLIATELENYQIPYRYEAVLRLGNKKESPDFTIKNPFTGKTIIWEHFGALHLPDYEKKMNEKMDAYLTHGYLPNETLIYTFEFHLKKVSRIQKIIEEIIL